MKDRETRRKIIREWMALPKEKRQTKEQVAAFAKKAAQQNGFHRSRRDPNQKFRRDPYQKLIGWLCLALAGRDWAAQRRWTPRDYAINDGVWAFDWYAIFPPTIEELAEN